MSLDKTPVNPTTELDIFIPQTLPGSPKINI